jgi:nitric oxide reductase NorQ protein
MDTPEEHYDTSAGDDVHERAGEDVMQERGAALLPVPREEEGFWIAARNQERLGRIALRSERGEQVNVLVRGPKGCGKTTLARVFAARWSRPFYEVHCGSFVDAEQWFGKDRLNGGETWYRKARFIHAVETPGCVVLLDEINRAHPEVLNAILGLLDWRRSMWSDDLTYEVSVAPGVIFFATINEGEDFYGVNPLDAAVRDRFPRTVRLDYPPRRQEAGILHAHGLSLRLSEKLTDFAHTLRKAGRPVPVSTRQLLVAAEEICEGASLREAVETSVIFGIDDVSLEKVALQALQWIEEAPSAAQENES